MISISDLQKSNDKLDAAIKSANRRGVVTPPFISKLAELSEHERLRRSLPSVKRVSPPKKDSSNNNSSESFSETTQRTEYQLDQRISQKLENSVVQVRGGSADGEDRTVGSMVFVEWVEKDGKTLAKFDTATHVVRQDKPGSPVFEDLVVQTEPPGKVVEISAKSDTHIDQSSVLVEFEGEQRPKFQEIPVADQSVLNKPGRYVLAAKVPQQFLDGKFGDELRELYNKDGDITLKGPKGDLLIDGNVNVTAKRHTETIETDQGEVDFDNLYSYDDAVVIAGNSGGGMYKIVKDENGQDKIYRVAVITASKLPVQYTDDGKIDYDRTEQKLREKLNSTNGEGSIGFSTRLREMDE